MPFWIGHNDGQTPGRLTLKHTSMDKWKYLFPFRDVAGFFFIYLFFLIGWGLVPSFLTHWSVFHTYNTPRISHLLVSFTFTFSATFRFLLPYIFFHLLFPYKFCFILPFVTSQFLFPCIIFSYTICLQTLISLHHMLPHTIGFLTVSIRLLLGFPCTHCFLTPYISFHHLFHHTIS